MVLTFPYEFHCVHDRNYAPFDSEVVLLRQAGYFKCPTLKDFIQLDNSDFYHNGHSGSFPRGYLAT